MSKISFHSTVRNGPQILPKATQDEIKKEPMLFQSSFEFADDNAGPLTKAFLNALEMRYGDEVAHVACIDSRVHMLMPGMFPCIPGWHHDDVDRNRPDSQPDYINHRWRSTHCMALWGSVSPTYFAVGVFNLSNPPLGSVVYRNWSPVVERAIKKGSADLYVAPERCLVHFDDRAFHRGSEAKEFGFRFFIRATWRNKAKYIRYKNEIRHNANVYMKDIDAGW